MARLAAIMRTPPLFTDKMILKECLPTVNISRHKSTLFANREHWVLKKSPTLKLKTRKQGNRKQNKLQRDNKKFRFHSRRVTFQYARTHVRCAIIAHLREERLRFLATSSSRLPKFGCAAQTALRCIVNYFDQLKFEPNDMA